MVQATCLREKGASVLKGYHLKPPDRDDMGYEPMHETYVAYAFMYTIASLS